jgi:hypothetical protein
MTGPVMSKLPKKASNRDGEEEFDELQVITVPDLKNSTIVNLHREIICVKLPYQMSIFIRQKTHTY